MFSSLGLFKQIACPEQDNCPLPSCIFSHSKKVQSTIHQHAATEYDPLSAGEAQPPPPKRRKIDHESSPSAEQPVEEQQATGASSASSVAEQQRARLASRRDGKAISVKPTTDTHITQTTSKPSPRSVTRPISPPPLKAKQPRPDTNTVDVSKPETVSLVPRSVPKPPAVLKNRLTILQSLHQQMVAQNAKVAVGDEKWKALVLNDQELIKFALDEEEDAARKFEAEIYRNSITQRILKLKKMSESEWRSQVMERTRVQSSGSQAALKATAETPAKITTGLDTKREELAVLRLLRTPLEGLEAYGYVTTRPTDDQIAAAKSAAETAAGWETCDRCGTRFQVFPGRNDEGQLTTRGPCRYHWAKFGRGSSHKTDRITGQAQSTYGCCNQQLGSDGCTECETHVFKVAGKDRLASILQFEYTPLGDEKKRRPPVSFDCEMGYTTLGLEVIRVTAVSWPAGKGLLDVLVRPYGEILDLNTRFSGVSNAQYAEATQYHANRPTPEAENPAEGEGVVEALQKVDSPAAARQLLFDLLTPETPLIGHAIDNDLNVVRIIHPWIIDTVLLYPHPRGLPIRFGLKVLSAKYLHRGIQMGGVAGHDSKEDALATGDLVTLKVAEKWKTMKLEGWQFEDELLLRP